MNRGYSPIPFRKSSFALDCQPLPVARSASSRSGSSRNVVDTLGFADFGRPGLTLALAKLASHSGVARSGISSRCVKSWAVGFLFSGIGFPHTDNSGHIGASCPSKNHHTVVQETDGYEPFLSIIKPMIRDAQSIAFEYFRSSGHIQISLRQGFGAFGRVVLNFHYFLLLQKILRNNPNARVNAW